MHPHTHLLTHSLTHILYQVLHFHRTLSRKGFAITHPLTPAVKSQVSAIRENSYVETAHVHRYRRLVRRVPLKAPYFV